mmetsp:Transcript_58654/g.164571  ORF Transcript_58654/g.164571 Transcript_58654/m.164571 type:complete len:245 (-) Transcript_58654:565-1299(-)
MIPPRRHLACVALRAGPVVGRLPDLRLQLPDPQGDVRGEAVRLLLPLLEVIPLTLCESHLVRGGLFFQPPGLPLEVGPLLAQLPNLLLQRPHALLAPLRAGRQLLQPGLQRLDLHAALVGAGPVRALLALRDPLLRSRRCEMRLGPLALGVLCPPQLRGDLGVDLRPLRQLLVDQPLALLYLAPDAVESEEAVLLLALLQLSLDGSVPVRLVLLLLDPLLFEDRVPPPHVEHSGVLLLLDLLAL